MRTRLKILFFSFLIFKTISSPADLDHYLKIDSSYLDDSTFIGQLEVKLWQDDKKSAFSFSFDDGLMSQFTFAFPILEQYGFKGTFYLIPPYVTDDLPSIWRYGTWKQFIEVSDSGNEIGSHSMTHPHFINLTLGDSSLEGTLLFELFQSKLMIDTKLPDKKCITFAYPYSEHNNMIDFYTSLFYHSARAVGPESNEYSLIDLSWFRLSSLPVVFDLPRDSLFNDLDEFDDFKNWAQITIDENKWGILQTHEVLPYSLLQDAIQLGLYEPVAAEWFDLVCSWIKEQEIINQIWVAPIAEVTKYMKERDSYSYQVIASSDDLIQIELSDTLDNEIYNCPLTADIIVPEAWNEITLIQNNKSSVYNSFFNGINFVVRVPVIPDEGIIEIHKGYITNAENIADQLPGEFILYQNYPNPFNPSTKIKYELKNHSHVVLSVSDVLGREIVKLVDSELEAGLYEITFDGSKFASGIYFYKIRVNNYQEVKKFILSK